MSPEFEKTNQEAFDDAAFDHIVNARNHQPERWLGSGIEDGLSNLGHHIGHGIAWFGFWIFLAVAAYVSGGKL